MSTSNCLPPAFQVTDISEEEANALLGIMNDPNTVKHRGHPLPPGDEEALKRKASRKWPDSFERRQLELDDPNE
jgi:hypothetical protein